MTVFDRFMSKANPEPNTGCWLWTGAVDEHGYGRLLVGRKNRRATRLAWELFCGPIPEGTGYHGTCICHRCDLPNCVNPAHLFLGTQHENMLDSSRKRRSRCRLAEESIAPIVMAYRAGVPANRLAKWFGVGRKTIVRVVSREHYAHVPL